MRRVYPIGIGREADFSGTLHRFVGKSRAIKKTAKHTSTHASNGRDYKAPSPKNPVKISPVEVKERENTPLTESVQQIIASKGYTAGLITQVKTKKGDAIRIHDICPETERQERKALSSLILKRTGVSSVSFHNSCPVKPAKFHPLDDGYFADTHKKIKATLITKGFPNTSVCIYYTQEGPAPKVSIILFFDPNDLINKDGIQGTFDSLKSSGWNDYRIPVETKLKDDLKKAVTEFGLPDTRIEILEKDEFTHETTADFILLVDPRELTLKLQGTSTSKDSLISELKRRIAKESGLPKSLITVYEARKSKAEVKAPERKFYEMPVTISGGPVQNLDSGLIRRRCIEGLRRYSPLFKDLLDFCQSSADYKSSSLIGPDELAASLERLKQAFGNHDIKINVTGSRIYLNVPYFCVHPVKNRFLTELTEKLINKVAPMADEINWTRNRDVLH